MNRTTRIRRIGIFDSGAGGLTVLKELRASFQGIRFYYLGDTARLPYGTKSGETIIRYTIQNTRFLLSKKIDLLIVACNTASAYALEQLRQSVNIPVIGVIEPGADRAVASSGSGRIGVIGTRATIGSGAYQKRIQDQSPEAVVAARPAPLLVPLVEEGVTDGPIAESVIRMYLDPLKDEGIDTLVLGCTHYPALTRTIGSLYPHWTLVDSATPIRDTIEREWTLDPDGGRVEIYVTDYPENFALLSQRFLEGEFDRIEHIDLQKLWRTRNGKNR